MKTAAMLAVAILALGSMLRAADDAVVAPQPVANRQSPIATDVGAVTIPQMMTYQGRLTDTTGVPVANGEYSITFKLYTQPTGGNSFWMETQNVTIRDGLFSVLLGSVTAITTGDGRPGTGAEAAYLGMTVEGSEEMTPRLRIAGTYALPSERLGANDNKGGGTDNDDEWIRSSPADSVLYTIRRLGVARGGCGNVLYGNYTCSMTNLGSACTTGISGSGGASLGNMAVLGGYGNRVWAPYTSVGGGRNNKAGNDATDTSAIVVGGYGNQANAKFSYIAGGQNNIASGASASIGGGSSNSASGIYASIGGGYADTVKAPYGGVLCGYSNLAGDATADTAACVVGGYNNSATGKLAFVGGGRGNTATDEVSTAGGGLNNVASNFAATVAGGSHNSATGPHSTVGGGASNTAQGDYSTAVGGVYSYAGYIATVGGGYSNTAGGDYSTVAGGDSNSAGGAFATVAGGDSNNAAGTATFIGGGYLNTATDYCAAVSGGSSNTVDASYSTLGGGWANNISSGCSYSTLGGGSVNSVTGWTGTVGGGSDNVASGSFSTVAGGQYCDAAGDYSFSVGNNSDVSSGHTNSAAFNGQTTTASGQTRVGALSKASGTFTIDHPLDPVNKILNHYFVESPDMSNIYSGSVVLDAVGRGEVRLPDYFDELNRNPRVQLTGVGTSEVVYVAEDIIGNRFVVGGKPGTKVYWQVTGDRKDPSAEITRYIMPVEQLKTGSLAGHSLDDDFLRSTKDQLDRMGVGGQFDFRTAAGRQKYEETKRAAQKHEGVR